MRNRFTWTRTLPDAAKLEVKLGITNNIRNQPVVSSYCDSNKTLLLNRHVDSLARDTSVTLGGKYRTPFLDTHALALGWDGEESRRWEDRIQKEIAPTGLATANSNEVFDTKVRRLALFGQDEWEVTPRWSSYLGLRWEGIETQSSVLGVGDTQSRSSVFSPILQNLWKVPGTQGDQVRLGLSRTYKAPSTSDLMPRRGISVDNAITSPDYQGNPALRPELAWGLDLAYERHFDDGGLLSANLFERRIQNVILYEVFQQNNRWITHPFNNGNAQVRGIELEAKHNLRTLFKSAPAVEFRANLARNWSVLEAVPGPDNRLNQQIPLSASIGADWRVSNLPLTLGGSFGYQRNGLVRLSGQATDTISDKRIFDAYGLWKIDAKTQLRIAATNLLHQDYLEESTYSDTWGSVVQTSRSATATTIRATLELKL